MMIVINYIYNIFAAFYFLLCIPQLHNQGLWHIFHVVERFMFQSKNCEVLARWLPFGGSHLDSYKHLQEYKVQTVTPPPKW